MPAAPVRVLLVEDSPSDAALLQEALEEARPGRFGFTHAERLADALALLRGDQFDVMLLDLSLPDATGRDTFLRARAAAPHLPIVVLTSVEDEFLGLDAVRHGIQDYLIKGEAHGRQTSRAIRYAIERKQAEVELKRTEAALRESERRLREWNLELERRVAERTAKLEETVSDLEDFSHSITHDLRAPLRAMRAFSQILQQECAASSSALVQDCLHRIITSAARMDKLIQDVLQYSRVARGELGLGPVDTAALLRGIIDSYPAFQPSQIEIQLEKNLPVVLGNEAALTQCFSNLLDNAVKFVCPGIHPCVHIRAEQLGHSRVRLWFEDNGIGIPENARERIFKLFHQLDKRHGGTGVGLTVVRKAVEKMGGKVGVNPGLTGGSSFWLDLACPPPPNPGAAGRPGATRPPAEDEGLIS